MFTIHTAKAGDAYHTLTPNERLIHIDPDLGAFKELRVAVRVDYGHPDGPYIIKFWLDDAYGVDGSIEVITDGMLRFRRQHAIANCAVYDSSAIYEVSDNHLLWRHAQSLKDHFLALMALKLFTLPACL